MRELQTEGPGPLHILVVDDEPMLRQLLRECLTLEGHTVETSAHGREGLEKFAVSERRGIGVGEAEGPLARKFDLVIVDRFRPEMDGDWLALALKQVAPDRPVIMLTGLGDFMLAVEEKPAGVDLVVGKPFTLTALREALAKVIGNGL
jgi:CheY-like chemotaxis protein